MSKERYWRAISVDSITPEYFPKVALFLKTSGNYVLYKDPDRMFTLANFSRLERTYTEFLYVRSGDMEVLNEFIENSIAGMLARNDLSSIAKGRTLYQTSVNCVIDMFESPETTGNLLRCRNLVQNLLQYVAAHSGRLWLSETMWKLWRDRAQYCPLPS